MGLALHPAGTTDTAVCEWCGADFTYRPCNRPGELLTCSLSCAAHLRDSAHHTHHARYGTPDLPDDITNILGRDGYIYGHSITSSQPADDEAIRNLTAAIERRRRRADFIPLGPRRRYTTEMQEPKHEHYPVNPPTSHRFQVLIGYRDDLERGGHKDCPLYRIVEAALAQAFWYG